MDFQAIWLFAHAWVGPGNIDPLVGTFLRFLKRIYERRGMLKLHSTSVVDGASTGECCASRR